MEKCRCRLPTMDGVITCFHPYKHKGIDSRNFHAGFVPSRATHLPKNLMVKKTFGFKDCLLESEGRRIMKNRTKELKAEMKFDELVDHASRDIHSALLTEGAKGMRTMIYLWLAKAIEWHCGEKVK